MFFAHVITSPLLLFILHFSLSIPSPFFSGVKTPLYNIGRAYGTWIDDLGSSIFSA